MKWKKTIISNIMNTHGNLELKKMIQTANKNDKLIEVLEEIIEQREYIDQKFITLLRYAAFLSRKEEKSLKREIYELVLKGLKIQEFPESIVSSSKNLKLPLQAASSFRACLTMRSRKTQLSNCGFEWKLNKKKEGYKFADMLGMPRPKVYEKIMKFSDIPRESNIVIKQSEGSGSKGVYLVFDHHRKIFDVMKSKMLDGWEHLELSIENDLQSKIVKKDKWIVEELLYENNDKKIPSRDLKFYCFYGRVALILEVCRYPEVKYCWWLSNGEKIKTGKYDKNLFDGEGFTQEDLQYVADVSKKIPAPFVRIDFLKTEKGLYLGEFTPRPGGYEGFSNYIDQFLGEYFLEAEGRLLNDLFNGKKFSEYKAFLEY